MIDGRNLFQRMRLKGLALQPSIVYMGDEIPLYYIPDEKTIVIPRRQIAMIVDHVGCKFITAGDGKTILAHLPIRKISSLEPRFFLEAFFMSGMSPELFEKSLSDFCDDAIKFYNICDKRDRGPDRIATNRYYYDRLLQLANVFMTGREIKARIQLPGVLIYLVMARVKPYTYIFEGSPLYSRIEELLKIMYDKESTGKE